MVVYSIYVFFFQYPTSLFLFLILYPVPPPSRLRPASVLPLPPPPCPTPPSFTHNFVTHTHTPHLSQLCHTPSFTHNFVTHHLSHTTLSNTIFHTQLCHTHTDLSHEGGCRQVPRLPRKVPRHHRATNISAPPEPAQCCKCHTCRAKWRCMSWSATPATQMWMSPSATLATQKCRGVTARSRARKRATGASPVP